MTSVFLHFLNLSITAGWMVLAVLMLRLCLKKAPRWITCVLWGLVALRLVVPFTVESPVSLIPDTKVVVSTDDSDISTPVVNSGVSAIDKSLNDWLQAPVRQTPSQTPIVQSPVPQTPSASGTVSDESADAVPDTSIVPDTDSSAGENTAADAPAVSRAQRILQIAAPVWLIGIGLMLMYELVSFLRVRARVWDAVRLYDNVWQSDRVSSPFIFGFFRPCIYVPYGLEESILDQVLSHEYAHLHRRDHWIKPFAFTLLAVYWYNPLLWVGYILLCRDIEVACDQRVVRTLDEDNRRQYATALLECGAERRSIAACPLAFGEVSLKQRIKSVLNYRKPFLWVVIASLVVCAVAAVCLLTVPKSEAKDPEQEKTVVVLSSQEVKPNQERRFYGTDTDGSIVSGGLDWLWEHAQNPDDKTSETAVPMVVSRSKAELDELMDALSDSELDTDMRSWFRLVKYTDAYFEDNALVWLFVPGMDRGLCDCSVTLEETDKGLRYVVSLSSYGSYFFGGPPDHCQHLLLFEVSRETAEQTDGFMTMLGDTTLNMPTDGAFLPLGDVDLDGDGVKETLQLHHDGIALDSTDLLVYKADGTLLLNDTVFNYYYSQCYLVPQEDGSSLILFVVSDGEDGSVDFAVLSLKDGARTVVAQDSLYLPNRMLNFERLIPYVETLSAYLEDAVLLYEMENGSCYYGEDLGETPRYVPLSWLDAYRDNEDDSLQDILENMIASYGGDSIKVGRLDVDGDGQQDSLFAVRYWTDTRYRCCLVVRDGDGRILTGFDIYSYVNDEYFADALNNYTSYVYCVMGPDDREQLKLVEMQRDGVCYVYDLAISGSKYFGTMKMTEWIDYTEENVATLLFHIQNRELYFPALDEATQNEYLSIDPTKYTVTGYNESITAYNAFLKRQRVAYECDDFNTMLYVSDLYATVNEKGIRSYTLADVTGDGVPDLITSGYEWNIFTYQSGRLLRLYQSAAGMFPELLSNGCLWEERLGGGNNYRYTKFFEIGTTYTVQFGEPGYDSDKNEYYVAGAQEDYSNDMWISKADFDAQTSAYFEASKSPALLIWYDYTTKQPTSQAMVQYLSLLNNAYYGADVYYALHDADFDGTAELLIKKQDDVVIGLPWENPTITNTVEDITWVPMTEKPLQLLDVTADGYSDVLVEYNESARGKQYAFLRWDTEKERLVMIPTIIYNPSFDSETAVIRSVTNGDEIVSYGMYRYDAQTENLICTHSLYFEENEQATGDSDRMKLVVTENGVTKTLYVRGEPYGLDKTDPQVAPYYAPDSFWNLDSLQWENYVGLYVSDYVHILQRNHSETEARYAIHDLDGDGWRELLVLEGTKLTVYALSEQKGMIRVLVEQDFQTATSRFLLTGDDHYPGLVYVCIGGGKEWYYYLSLDKVENDSFVFTPLWTDNYAEFDKDEDGRITILHDDAQLIAVSRDATTVPFVSYDL